MIRIIHYINYFFFRDNLLLHFQKFEEIERIDCNRQRNEIPILKTRFSFMILNVCICRRAPFNSPLIGKQRVTPRARSYIFHFNSITENLQYLRLGDNNLHAVPSDALRRLHRLRHLDLKANNITLLPEDAFTGYGDSITFLNLQKNL